jgi:regulator of nucleoside diphosphate kinase
MQQFLTLPLRPAITIGETDHRQLLGLAMASADAADDLLDEMERANIVPDADLPDEVVRMGSAVIYRPNGDPQRMVQLVYPKDADIAAGKISVLTPIGTALLGLRKGQSISWRARDGRRHTLTVLWVGVAETVDGEGPDAA